MISGKGCVREPIPVARLTLRDGWRAWAVLRDSEGNPLSRGAWEQFFAEPERLASEEGTTLKADGLSSVVVRTVRVGERPIGVVIKTQRRGPGVKELVRWLRPVRAFRTFRTARMLRAMGIASEYPLAAAEQRTGLCARCSIYVSGYVENSRNMYYFLRDDLDSFGRREAACRRAAARQIAEILAALHNGGLWHRDAKAGNFVVQGHSAGSCALTLVDLDGIKRYLLGQRRSRFRSLVKLASTVLCHRSIHRSDYWRTFSLYCELTGLREGRRRVFRELSRRAVATRLLTMATSAIEGRGTFVDAP